MDLWLGRPSLDDSNQVVHINKSIFLLLVYQVTEHCLAPENHTGRSCSDSGGTCTWK